MGLIFLLKNGKLIRGTRLVRPAVYNITIPQRATFRQYFDLPIDCTGHSIASQVWDEKRRNKVIEFDIEWDDQAQGKFYLVADHTKTVNMKKDGEWDLMVIYANGERDYWVEGQAILDPGYTDPDD